MKISAGSVLQFHDAELIALTLDHIEQTASLTFKIEDGSTALIRFERISGIRTSDLFFQNVVSRILIGSVNWHGGHDSIRELITWIYSVDGRATIDSEMIDKYVLQVADGSIELFHCDPSWGVEIGVLCGAISMDPT